MLQLLKVRLELREAQEAPISEVLKVRAKELQELQEFYRKTGVFNPPEYGERLARMKVTWYRRIDGVLDSEQHWRFERLVDEGFFRPGTDFSVDLLKEAVLR
jgi:23S rRNA G2445 N2-methylase RlmL